MDRHSMGGNGELQAILNQRRRMVEGSSPHFQSPIVGSRSGASSAPTAARLPQHRLSAPGCVGTNSTLRPSPVGARQLNPSVFQDHPYRHISGGSQVVPPPSHRERETQEKRMSEMMAVNKELRSEVATMEATLLTKGESSTFNEERNLLLAETDTLLAETDRMSEQSKQLLAEKEEFGAQKAVNDRIVFELHREVDEMREENAESRHCHSEFMAEMHASSGSKPGNSECYRVLEVENEGLKKQTNELSLEVVNLKAKLQHQTQLLDSTQAHHLQLSEAFQIERTQLTEDIARLQREAEQANDRLQQGVRQAEVSSASGGSEGRLRVVMSQPNSSSEDLKSAVKAVEAVLGEARRELDRKLQRERRAAYEKLCSAIEKADEAKIEEALLQAQKAELDESDIKKAEDKLLELRSMTEEQKAAKSHRELENQRKGNAFLLVKKDQAAELQAFIEGFEEGVRWMDWRDYAGRTLYKAAQELHAETVKALLARMLGLKEEKPRPSIRKWGGGSYIRQLTGEFSPSQASESRRQAASFSMEVPDRQDSPAEVVQSESEEDEKPIIQTVKIDALCKQRLYLIYDKTGKLNLSYQEKPISETEEAELKTKAFRAVVKDDEDALNEILETVAMAKWEKWRNKADKDLLTLSQERGSSLAYSVVAKAMGILKEQARDTFEYGEAVWIFKNGDVQARRATVKEEASEEVDKILVEYWDGYDDPVYVDRPFVRKSG